MRSYLLLGFAAGLSMSAWAAPPKIVPPKLYEFYDEEGGRFAYTKLFADGKCFATRRRIELMASTRQPPNNSGSKLGLLQEQLQPVRSVQSAGGKDASAEALSLPSYYLRHQKVLKADVVCVGDDLVFDSPIFTNGGDIFIFASKVTIRAPIDTRIYLPQFPKVAIFRPYEGPENLHLLQQTKNVLLNYLSYYTGCETCDLNATSLPIPRLPSGIVGPMALANDQGSAGPAPPDDFVNFEAARSGSIHIEAKGLTIAAESTYAGAPLLQVSGMGGGLGGPGARATCGGAVAGMFSCANPLSYTNSGFNSAGGRGGDAGNISVSLVDTQVSDLLSNSIKEMSAADGGVPGPSKVVKYPPSTKAGQPVVPISKWTVLDDPHLPTSPSGKDGLISIRSVGLREALAQIYAFTSSTDRDVDSDRADLIYRSNYLGEIANTGLESFVNHRFIGATLEAQRMLALDLDARIDGGKPKAKRPLWPILWGVSSVRNLDVSPQSRSTVFLLSTVDVDDGIVDYFQINGGAFALQQEDMYTRYWQEVMKLAAKKQSELTAQELTELTAISGLTLEGLVLARSKELEDDLDDALDALRIAEAEARKSDKPYMTRLVNSVESAAKPIGACVVAIKTGNVASVASTIGPALQSARDVQIALAGIPSGSSEATQFQEAVTRARIAIESFNAETDAARNDVMNRRTYAQFQQLQQRMSRQSTEDNRSGVILDLFRFAVISFATDPFRPVGKLKNNAIAIAAFASQLPDQEPNFQFGGTSHYCDAGISPATSNGMCIGVQPNEKWQFVKGRFAKDSTFEVTLYAIAPGAGPFVLPVNGTQVRLVTAEGQPKVLSAFATATSL